PGEHGHADHHADRAADHRQRTGAEADFGQQSRDFPVIPADRTLRPHQRTEEEKDLIAQGVQEFEAAVDRAPYGRHHAPFGGTSCRYSVVRIRLSMNSSRKVMTTDWFT